jgi:hypothetical protein
MGKCTARLPYGEREAHSLGSPNQAAENEMFKRSIEKCRFTEWIADTARRRHVNIVSTTSVHSGVLH